MKKIINILQAIIVGFLFFTSCQDTFIDLSGIYIKTANVEVDYSTAKIYGIIQNETSLTKISKVMVSYGPSKNDLSTTVVASYDQTNGYSANIVNLKDGSEYFFRIDAFVGKASISSEINSFITFPIGPIELDLPSGNKWASQNLGAKKPTDAGSYFAWGETSEKTDYSWASYAYSEDEQGYIFTKYTTYDFSASSDKADHLTLLEYSDDAAYNILGADWKTPSYKDWRELIDNCIITEAKINGISGCRITSKKEPNNLKKWIFLPAQYGYYNKTTLYDLSYASYYWSSTLSSLNDFSACNFMVNSFGDISDSTGSRCYGETIRPICK